MSNINQFSIQALPLNSVLRQTRLIVTKAQDIINLKSTPSQKEQNSIQLFRNIQKLALNYQSIRGESTERKQEKRLRGMIKSLKKDVTSYLARQKKANPTLLTDQLEPILIKITRLDDELKKILLPQKENILGNKDLLYAGVDGGGSSSKAVIADQYGKILGRAKSGPSFPATVGYVSSFANILQAIKKATINAGLETKTIHFKRICIGTAGIDTIFDHKNLNNLLHAYSKLQNKSLDIDEGIIIQDSLLAWFGAFRGKPGIIVNGGTGDFVYGYNRGKDAHSNMPALWNDWTKTIRLGGRIIGFHSARKVRSLINEGKQSLLTDTWRNAFINREIFHNTENNISFEEILNLIEKSGTFDKIVPITAVAATTELVIGAAQKGDRDAKEIIQTAVKNLALHVTEVAKKIDLHKKQFEVVHTGSVIRNPFVLNQFRQTLNNMEPRANLRELEVKPQIGAINIAINDIRFY